LIDHHYYYNFMYTDMTGHPYMLEIKRSRLELHRNFYSQRVIHHWNSLPEHVVMADTVNTFKNRLDKEWGTISSPWTLPYTRLQQVQVQVQVHKGPHEFCHICKWACDDMGFHIIP